MDRNSLFLTVKAHLKLSTERAINMKERMKDEPTQDEQRSTWRGRMGHPKVFNCWVNKMILLKETTFLI